MNHGTTGKYLSAICDAHMEAQEAEKQRMRDSNKAMVTKSCDGLSAIQPMLSPTVLIFCPMCSSEQNVDMNIFWKRDDETHRFWKISCCSDACHKQRIRVGKWLRRPHEEHNSIESWLKYNEVYKDEVQDVKMTVALYLTQVMLAVASRKRSAHTADEKSASTSKPDQTESHYQTCKKQRKDTENASSASSEVLQREPRLDDFSTLAPLFANLMGQPEPKMATSLRGLNNLGNTCYGNALIVGISRLPHVRGWLSTHARTMAADPKHKTRTCTACILAHDMQNLTDTEARTPITPALMTLSGLWSPAFVQGAQQDVEEAFQNLFAACDASDVQQLRLQLRLARREAMPQRALYATPYYAIFGGDTQTFVQCTTCTHVATRSEPITTLQLSLKRNLHTLDELVRAHLSLEPCPNDYRCTNRACTMTGTTNKQIKILRWPRILLVHLKRWFFDERTNMFHKNDDMLHFPAAYTPVADVAYSLRSIVVHIGHAKGGHYVAYTLDERHGWLYYNDAASPKRVDEQAVLRQCPYLLFYERV